MVNLPNTITMVRILCVPVFINLLIYDRFGYASAVFFAAAVSDGLDGLIARVCNQRTRLGMYLDPLADKLLLTSAFMTLSILRQVPIWLTTIVVSRDLIVALGTLLLHVLSFHVDILPSWLGKVTTVLQFGYIMIILAVESLALDKAIAAPVALAVAVVTIGSGLHYVWRGARAIRAEPAGR
jgi:cardiolipin synthase (CMP-forming)